MEPESAFPEDAPPFRHVGPFEPHHQRHAKPYLAHRGDHAFGHAGMTFHQNIGLQQAGGAGGVQQIGLGALYAVNRVPDALEPIYGGDPDGAMVFVRLRLQ